MLDFHISQPSYLIMNYTQQPYGQQDRHITRNHVGYSRVSGHDDIKSMPSVCPYFSNPKTYLFHGDS